MWETSATTCPLCAAPLVSKPIRGRERKRCTRCTWVLYRNPASAALGVVLDDRGRVLLVKRSIQPFLGHWALPAGYQELDEDLPTTARREVLEETGIECEVLGLLEMLWVPDDPRKPANVALFLCRAVGGAAEPGVEESEVGWFALDALPEPLGFHNYERILERLAEPDRYPDPVWDHLRTLLQHNDGERASG